MSPDLPPSRGPLAGLRVIEIAAIGPVPLCGMLLGDLGADVVRIDRVLPSGLGLPMAPAHDVNARGRRSLMLDLKQPAGRDVLLRLVQGADVLLEGFRPGVMERLGLGPDACLAREPRLVYGRMTGFGQQGPLADAAGHDLNYIALTGVLAVIGPGATDSGATAAAGGAADPGRPLPPLNLVGDYGGGGMLLALGVLAALWERQRSGQGQVVDAAMVDGAATLASIFHGLMAAGSWQSQRGSNLLDGGAPFYDCYRCADGRWLSVAALETKFFAAFAAGIGLPASFVQRQHDRNLWPAMRAAIAERLATRDCQAWCEHLAGQDACVAPVLRFDEAPLHPHARARGAYLSIEGVLQPAPAPA
jgi:alpha-methylacyl-CoA racemase